MELLLSFLVSRSSINNIFYLLTREYLVLIGVAAGFGLPIGYYFVSDWLSSFASQMEITMLLFLIPIILILILTLITI